MPYQETSREAYHKVNLNAKQIIVRNFFKYHPRQDFTNAEVAQALGWSINRVTPRTGELVKLGEIEVVSRRACKVTGNMALSKRYVSV